MYIAANGVTTIAPGNHTMMLGVYGGRLNSSDQFEAQIGHVWPITLVNEIIDNGVPDIFRLNG